VKLLDDTVAVQVPFSYPRWSLTVTEPSVLETDAVPSTTLPRLALAGTLIVRDPPVMANVVVVGPVAATAAGASTTAPPKAATAMAGTAISDHFMILPVLMIDPRARTTVLRARTIYQRSSHLG
jgi:hypothetical protein